MKYILVLLSFCFVLSSSAATKHLRAGASGANNGNNWTDAYTSFTTAVNALARGDTLYIADGDVSGGGSYSFTTANSGTTRITIKKATVAEHGSATGWLDTYGDGQAVIPTLRWLSGSSSYWTIDGVTGGGPGSWTSGYGFRIDAGFSQGVFCNVLGVGNNIIQHIDMEGPGRVAGSCVQMVQLFGFAEPGFPNWQFRYLWLRNLNSGAFHISTTRDILVEYCYIDKSPSYDACHGEAVYCQEGLRGIFRFSQWRDVEGTGVIMLWGSGFEVYGNLIWWETAAYKFTSNGSIAGWGNYAVNNSKIYNNTVVDGLGLNQGIAFLNPGSSGNVAWNNLLVNNETAYNGGVSEQSNIIDNDTSRFVNYAAQDFRLGTAVAGSSVSSPYNVDVFGDTRGADGVTDIGYDEYNATPDTVAPVVSSVSSGTPGQSSATITFTTDEAATNYLVYWIGAGASLTNNNATFRTSHSQTLNSLTDSSTYNFYIVAGDTAGNSTNAWTNTFNTAVPDVTAPSVTLTAPTNGATISGVFALTATASDAVGVVGVRFYVDNTEVADDTSSPYSYSWSSASVTNGSHAIRAQARDAAGNLGNSATNTVTVTNAPGQLPDPIAYWPFDENTGTLAEDSIGTNDMTLKNGATWATGKFGSGLSLDGVNDRADAVHNTALDLNGDKASAAVWLKLTSTGGYQQPFNKIASTGSDDVSHHIYCEHVSATTYRPAFQVKNAAGNYQQVSSSVTVNYGEFVHVIGVYDGSEVRIYVNGVNRGSAAFSGNLASFQQPLYLGSDGQPAEFAKGVIDEPRLYGVALVDTNATDLYNLNPGGGATVPGTPQLTGITSGYDGDQLYVDVSWSQPNDGGAAITRNLLYGATNTASPVLIADIAAATSKRVYTATMFLANSTSYQFSVRATNSVGIGGFSATNSVVTPAAPASNLRVGAVGASRSGGASQ
jgi:hypothetical protein